MTVKVGDIVSINKDVNGYDITLKGTVFCVSYIGRDMVSLVECDSTETSYDNVGASHIYSKYNHLLRGITVFTEHVTPISLDNNDYLFLLKG